MAFINLTGRPAQFPLAFEELNICTICNKPFNHSIKKTKIKDTNEIIYTPQTAHPCCKRMEAKAEKIKEKIIKTKKTLHDLRAEQLNLEFELFCKQQLKLDDDTDEIFVMLKEKQIVNS